MRITGTTTLLLASMASAASGISLSNFIPKVDNLPSQCNDVYNRQINGCQASDFSRNTPQCSSSCVSGLIDIQKAIAQACQDADVSETSIVGVFLAGNGVSALCSSNRAAQSSSQQQQQTSTRQQSSAVQSSSSTSSSSSSTIQSTTTQAAATTPANIPPAAGPPPTSAAQPQQSSSSSSKASSTPTAQSQKSNKDSGGGSPFDVQNTGGVERLETSMGMMFGSVFLLVAFL